MQTAPLGAPQPSASAGRLVLPAGACVSKRVRLFQSTWTNPQPDLEITRLEYRIGETALEPLAVSITAE